MSILENRLSQVSAGPCIKNYLQKRRSQNHLTHFKCGPCAIFSMVQMAQDSHLVYSYNETLIWNHVTYIRWSRAESIIVGINEVILLHLRSLVSLQYTAIWTTLLSTVMLSYTTIYNVLKHLPSLPPSLLSLSLLLRPSSLLINSQFFTTPTCFWQFLQLHKFR